jgi:hypothetical protein
MGYAHKWQTIAEAFVDKLREGTLFCSAIEDGADDRACIKPGLWDVLEIAFDVGIVAGRNREFQEPEFFDASSVPLNVEPLADWLKEILTVNSFEHDKDYRHVTFKGIRFEFGELQAGIVRLLHAASQTDNPWRKGAEVIEEAGSHQAKMVDVFRSQSNWRSLIESTPRGFYRLRVDQRGRPLRG